jgi:hypothetical protein
MNKVVPIHDEDDVIADAGDGGVLLPVTEVHAICRSMKLVEFRMYRRSKYVLRFDVISPPEYGDGASLSLYMYLRFVRSWRSVPTSSSLYKAACTAYGRRLRGGERITKSLFVGKLFRCRLRTVGEGAAAYSVIDRLIERLA